MKIAKNVTKLGTELVYDIFAKTKKLQAEGKKIKPHHFFLVLPDV